MAHHIETFGPGRAAFFSARADAWHRLGTVTTDCLTATEVMKVAYLGGWNVHKTPLRTDILSVDGVTTVEIPHQYATVRTNPVTGQPDVLGVVGKDYKPVQNEECADLLDALVDEFGARFETAGSLRGGRQVFITMKLPETMRVGGVDDIDLYLAASTSHDGSAALRVDATPIRVVCANTLRVALRTAKATYSLRHTSGAKVQAAQVRDALGLMWDYYDEFSRAAERMINQTMTQWEFERVIDQLWPQEPNPSTRTRNNHIRRMDQLCGLYLYADTQAAIRGTRWAGYQAITEYLDHFSPAANATVRATKVLTSATFDDVKQRAYDLLAV